MTWKFMGYGEREIVGRIVGKPGVNKGGQIAVVSDASCCRPRAYVHRHTSHPIPNDSGFIRETCNSWTSSRDIKSAGLNLGTLSKIESSSAMICL